MWRSDLSHAVAVLHKQAMNWAQLTGAGGTVVGAGALVVAGAVGGMVGDPATKQFRELFVGNVVEGTSGTDLHEFLGAVMQEVPLFFSSHNTYRLILKLSIGRPGGFKPRGKPYHACEDERQVRLH